jgi:hypothetical protein
LEIAAQDLQPGEIDNLDDEEDQNDEADEEHPDFETEKLKQFG